MTKLINLLIFGLVLIFDDQIISGNCPADGPKYIKSFEAI